MLRQLRQKKVMKRILWVLAAIIIPAFVLWGAGSMGERGNYAGIIFGRKVSINEYVNAWEAAKNEMLMTYGSRFEEVAGQIDLDEQAWERLIMVKEAKRKKIRVENSEVISVISRIPFFLDKDGAFDQKRYEVILNNTFRRSPRKFEEDVRESLLIIKLTQNVFESVSVSDAEVEEALLKEMEKEKKAEEEKKKKEVKKPAEEGEKKEETPEEKKERIKNLLLFQKKFQALQVWRDQLYQEAALVDNIKKLKEKEAAGQVSQEPPEEIPQEKIVE